MTDNFDLNKEGIENNFLDVLKEVVRQLEALENGTASVGSLDELSGDLGIITAGEFRSPADPTNPKDPGSGFDGVRMSGAPMSYNSLDYAIACVLNDVLQCGMNISQGRIDAGAGTVWLDEDGITIDITDLSGPFDVSAYKFSNFGAVYGGLYGYPNNVSLQTAKTGDSNVMVKASNPVTGKVAYLKAAISSGNPTIDIVADTIEITGTLTNNGSPIGAAEYPNRFACMGDELKSTAAMGATYSISQTYTVYWVQTAANSNDGDTYTFSCILDSGAYNITVLGALANTAALIDVYIDDVLVASGWDWYAAATTYNTKKILYDRVIATGGLHTFKFVVNGKNASSTDYVWAVTKIMVSKDSDLTGYGGSRTVTINSNGQNSIGSLNPTNVYSANLYVGEMNNLAANVFRGLVYFADLSNGQGIPAGATITGAKLKLCPKTDYANNAGTIEVYRLLRSGIVVSQATWNIYSKGNSWETAGCAGTTSDREATTIGTLATANNLTIDTYIEITLDPALVQEMILNGDLANYGLHLKTTSESDDGYEYYPYNGTYPAQLQITYSVTEP